MELTSGRILKAVAWTGGSMLLANMIAFSAKLVLARLLLPEDFGVVGMALVFTGLVQVLSELGLTQALIQRKEKELSAAHLNVAFWTSLALGVLLFLFMTVVLAPLIASFYAQPALRSLVPAMSIPLLLRPFSVVQRAMLSRALDFRRLGIAETASTTGAGIVAITLALHGLGAWSIVIQGIVQASLGIILINLLYQWRPSLRFSPDAFREISIFGVYTMSAEVLVYGTANMDYLLIGRFLGAEQLGIYTLAFLLTDTLRRHFMAVIGRVMYPVYGQLQGNITRIAQMYLQVVKFNCLLLFPVLCSLIVIAEPLVAIAFGQPWMGTVLPLQILSGAAIIHALGGTGASVVRAMGRPDLEFKISVVESLVVGLPLLVIGIHYGGLPGAAAAVLMTKLVSRILFQLSLSKLAGVRWWSVGYAAAPACAASVTMIIVALLFRAVIEPTDLMLLASMVIVSWAVYAAVAMALAGKSIRAAFMPTREGATIATT